MIYLIFILILIIPPPAFAMEMQQVKRVVDGDTLLLEDNRLIRYIGINAPEVQYGNEMAEPFGREAKKQHMRFLNNEDTVYMVYGTEKSDQYGRKLAYVYTPEKSFINRMMLEQGWAYYLYKEPNVRHHDLFLQAQRIAMQNHRGIWQNWKRQPLNILGNKRSKRFHRQKCPFGMQTGNRNRTAFSGLWEAFWEGYAPCKKCFPKGPF